ncbi:hypothetical protein H0R92_11420 [Treponema sp. OMZ 840]|uniref:YqiA/YcfP family alpha/beta fold hydrolase n=1 Tax=Treponema sp. OMZ 840 TaxID=244313 RepID=UPI003D8D2661
MNRALYIHGLNSDKNSHTGHIVKSLMSGYGVEPIIPSFPSLNPEQAVLQINSIIKDEDIKLVIGHSLGGFYTLAARTGPMKIYINPCFAPADILPSLTDEADGKVLDIFRRLTEEAFERIGAEEKAASYGIFAKNDTLFSFYELFKRTFGNNCTYINGGHKPEAEDLAQGFKRAAEFLPFALNTPSA